VNGQNSVSVDRVMGFIDGTNFLVSIGEALGISLFAATASENAYTLAAGSIKRHLDALASPHGPVRRRIIRGYWFGAVQGSPEVLEQRRALLRRQGFEAVLFPQKKGGKGEKGVDLAVAREMLIHGFKKNYDVAVLFAGDEDYVGLIQDIKRLGIITIGMFFDSAALSPRLRVEFDEFWAFEFPLPSDDELIDALRVASNAA
jgi:uncharacterized LabA/DUF88 family protein